MTRTIVRRSVGFALSAAGCALLLAGCTPATATTEAGTASASASSRPTGAPTLPGASGMIAEINGTTLQVQDADSQTAVTYTASTSFSRQVNGAIGDVTVGSCVRVTSADAADATAVAATSIAVTDAVDGQCVWAGGGDGSPRAGGRPSGAQSGAPSGMPSGAPGGMPSGLGRMLAGQVAVVDGDVVTVSTTQPGAGEATTITVTLTDDTVVTTTEKASAAALDVGLCATARGDADTTGAITATAISLSDAVDGECRPGR